MKRWTSTSMMIALAAAAGACGKATGTSKQGTGLATLRGQLVAGPKLAENHGPVRLAVAWYPAWATFEPGTPAKAVVTQRASFQGSFPLDFTLQLDAPPPAEALADLAPSGGLGHAAWGVIIAFEDRNGNGALDLIPAGGTPIDKVLGTSIGDLSQPAIARGFAISYLDGTAGPGDLADVVGSRPGFNLMLQHAAGGTERVPLDTSISIQIGDSPGLDLFVCPEAFQSDGSITAGCGIDVYGTGYQLQADVITGPSFVSKPGNTLKENVIWILLNDSKGEITTAAVTANGQAVDFDPQLGYLAPLVAGENSISVSMPGRPTQTLSATALPPMQLTLPASLPRGSPINVSWQAVPGIELYDVTVFSPDHKTLLHQLTTDLAVTTPALDSHLAGKAQVKVMALAAPLYGVGNSNVQAITWVRSTVQITP